MITILLAGQARVGKTTAANIIAKLAKKWDMKPIILPFAKAIKDEAAAAGLTKDANPVEYRQFCQNIGGGKRSEDPDYWIKKFREQLAVLQKKDDAAAQDETKIWSETLVIVDDCRYLNELNFGRSIGARTILISKGSRELAESNASWRHHESEDMANQFEAGNKDYQDIFEFIIRNEGSEDDFKKKLKERLPLLLNVDPAAYCPCDCIGCSKMKRDELMTLDEFFEELMKEEDEED